MISINADEYALKIGSKDFYLDVIQGLAQVPKKLPSKYFYDKKGDKLFQEIMMSPDYYLTRCEMEIFTHQTKEIVDSLTEQNLEFELIELGPGNCAKSIHLLQALTSSCIWTEISQKYSKDQIRQMAINNGFIHAAEFLDTKSWFMDVIWTAV
ncbi:MAG: hypothetical protein JWR54_1158 [Mucilaginibacter sp.]|nr:hypothetical protein [Mucilaginibacter sp.]